jgi:gas vesicle protein
VGDAASGAVVQVRQQAEGNPLAAGLVAFGVGWLVSSLLPATEAEQRATRRAVEAAKEQGVVDQAKQVAQDVGSHMQDQAQQAAQQVKDKAQDATETVKQEAQSATQDVKQTATGAAQDVRDETQQHVEAVRSGSGSDSGSTY